MARARTRPDAQACVHARAGLAAAPDEAEEASDAGGNQDGLDGLFPDIVLQVLLHLHGALAALLVILDGAVAALFVVLAGLVADLAELLRRLIAELRTCFAKLLAGT